MILFSDGNNLKVAPANNPIIGILSIGLANEIIKNSNKTIKNTVRVSSHNLDKFLKKMMFKHTLRKIQI